MSDSNLRLIAGDLGVGRCFSTYQELYNAMFALGSVEAPAVSIGGGGGGGGGGGSTVLPGPVIPPSTSTPAVEDQDKIWPKLTGSGDIDGLFYFKDGTWQRIIIPQMFAMYERYGNNTMPTPPASLGVFLKRKLNTPSAVISLIPGLSFSIPNSQITIPPGLYFIQAMAFGWQCGEHIISIYNTGIAQQVLYGCPAYASPEFQGQSISSIADIYDTRTHGSADTIELQHLIERPPRDGIISTYGRASALVPASVFQTFASIEITRLA